jgi:hypothetical protein
MRELFNRKSRSFWSVALLIGGIAILAIFLLLDRPEPAVAFTSYLTQAEALYPGIVGSRIDNCLLCHVSPDGGNRNPYGSDFASNGHSFTAIENMDSDLDGILNIDEINALTYPGDPADPPAATSTPSPTATGQPPTATRTPTATGQTPIATDTPTATGQTPIATDTPTATGQTPIATDTPTATGQTPIATDTPTATGQPPIATDTPTVTGQPPTATPTPTVTPGPTAISGNNLIRLPVVLNSK